MTSLSPAFLETHLLYLTYRLLKDKSKDVLSKLIASATGSVRCQLHVNQTLYMYVDSHTHKRTLKLKHFKKGSVDLCLLYMYTCCCTSRRVALHVDMSLLLVYVSLYKVWFT